MSSNDTERIQQADVPVGVVCAHARNPPEQEHQVARIPLLGLRIVARDEANTTTTGDTVISPFISFMPALLHQSVRSAQRPTSDNGGIVPPWLRAADRQPEVRPTLEVSWPEYKPAIEVEL